MFPLLCVFVSDAKVQQKINNPNFFYIFFTFFCGGPPIVPAVIGARARMRGARRARPRVRPRVRARMRV